MLQRSAKYCGCCKVYLRKPVLAWKPVCLLCCCLHVHYNPQMLHTFPSLPRRVPLFHGLLRAICRTRSNARDVSNSPTHSVIASILRNKPGPLPSIIGGGYTQTLFYSSLKLLFFQNHHQSPPVPFLFPPLSAASSRSCSRLCS